ncbi:MAG: ATP/GTP-binding protein [Desulfurococcaceae archaeon]|nr:ATP/GTP-binding protein [Desulfurococcaceae archaeon]
MPTVVVVFTGPAGSGKSSLVKAYSEWARKTLFLKVAIVNLDPGADELSYNPIFDIRRLFTLRDIMLKYNLGPNGAFIKASELIAEKITEIFSEEPFTDINKWDLVLIDTPGQMEAFLFRPASRVFLEELAKISHAILVYVIDASAIQKVSDGVFLWFLFVLLQVKTGLLAVPVINKRDIASNPKIVKLLVEDPSKLIEEAREEGLSSEIISDLIAIAEKTKGPFRAVLVSAFELGDMERLHQLIHEAFCVCGDLT